MIAPDVRVARRATVLQVSAAIAPAATERAARRASVPIVRRGNGPSAANERHVLSRAAPGRPALRLSRSRRNAG